MRARMCVCMCVCICVILCVLSVCDGVLSLSLELCLCWFFCFHFKNDRQPERAYREHRVMCDLVNFCSATPLIATIAITQRVSTGRHSERSDRVCLHTCIRKKCQKQQKYAKRSVSLTIGCEASWNGVLIICSIPFHFIVLLYLSIDFFFCPQSMKCDVT